MATRSCRRPRRNCQPTQLELEVTEPPPMFRHHRRLGWVGGPAASRRPPGASGGDGTKGGTYPNDPWNATFTKARQTLLQVLVWTSVLETYTYNPSL